MKMVRHQQQQQQLYVTVPSLFRCPISLDVMKSPVSLCTGVTYDRSSIQHWLESGHDTCPATMQVLSSKDLIPNLTLHRLISLWSAQSSSMLSPSATRRLVRSWIDNIEASLQEVLEFSGSSEDNRRILVNYGGFLEALFGVFKRETAEVRVLEIAVRVLDLIRDENGAGERLRRLVDEKSLISLVSVLREGEDSLSKIAVVRLLESLSLSGVVVSEMRDLFPVLVNQLGTGKDASLHDAILSLLVCLCSSSTRLIKARLIELGLVKELFSIILSKKNAADGATEKSLRLLASVAATCSEGRAAMSEQWESVGRVVERMMLIMKASKMGAEDAVLVVWSLCCLGKDERVVGEVIKRNGLRKMLLVMQSSVGEDGRVRMMCRDLVKALRGANLDHLLASYYETKTTHIMPC